MSDYIDLIKENMPNPGCFQDAYAFSLHKCGSSLMNEMISEACRRADVEAVSIPDLLFKYGVTDDQWTGDGRLGAFFEKGRIYFGFRYLPELFKKQISLLDGKKITLLIRDPRDALVSMYFSFGGKHISHVLPEKNSEQILANWKKTAHLNIDDYVLQTAPMFLQRFIDYKEYLYFENVLLCRYEDVYYDKVNFLSSVFKHFGVNISSSIIKDVSSLHDIRPASEDPTKHIRKGIPGDHREKLQPETISRLNEMLSDVCLWYGYHLYAK